MAFCVLANRQKGALTRFLGLDGDIGFEGVDFAQHWNSYLLTDDFVNANTGLFDPRHMFGTTNQGMLVFFSSFYLSTSFPFWVISWLSCISLFVCSSQAMAIVFSSAE